MKNLALLATLACCASASADCDGCPDWLYARSDFTHSPATGARVVQYAPDPVVEGLPDPRDVTSRYTRNTTILRGVDGSTQTTYEVQSFGSARGGFEAQTERAFDASLQQLRALEPFRYNPWLFYGAAVGPGGVGGVPGASGAPGGAAQGPIPSGGFPPFGVPTQPYGGAGYYGPGAGWGFPVFGGPYGGWPYLPPGYGPPGYGPPGFGPPVYGAPPVATPLPIPTPTPSGGA